MMSSSSSSSICGTEAKEEFYRKGLLGSMHEEESKNTSHAELAPEGGEPPLGDRRAIEELIKETQDTFKRFEELKQLNLIKHQAFQSTSAAEKVVSEPAREHHEGFAKLLDTKEADLDAKAEQPLEELEDANNSELADYLGFCSEDEPSRSGFHKSGPNIEDRNDARTAELGVPPEHQSEETRVLDDIEQEMQAFKEKNA